MNLFRPMMNLNQGAAYSVVGGDELFERGSFEPRIIVGWKPLTAAQYNRLGKDCDQCGFYRHGYCNQGAKAVEKAANDSCNKFNWKGVLND
jgi:hypothetical protein